MKELILLIGEIIQNNEIVMSGIASNPRNKEKISTSQ